MTAGVFVPGGSLLHCASPGIKLVVLASFAVAISLTNNTASLVIWTLLLAIAWWSSRIGWFRLVQLLRPLWLLLFVLFVFQSLIEGLAAGINTVFIISILIAAAGLVSYTTRTTDMLKVLERALKPISLLGGRPHVIAFAIVFAVRLVPFVTTVGHEVIEARVVRGGSRNPISSFIPMIIRLMRETDTMAEALVARGYERI